MSTNPTRARLQSFVYAFRGAATLLRTQPNARIHAVATLLVVAGGLFLGLSAPEWSMLTVAITMVWTAEALNTAVEFLADEVTLEQRPRIAQAKDVAAFAVLVSSIAAVVIGLTVFVPRLLHFH